jgi:L-asparaginase
MPRTAAIRLLCLSLVASGIGATSSATETLAAAPAVGIVHAVGWSPGDSARDGAAEFAVLVCAAQLQRASRAAGIIAVGNQRGMLDAAAERALRRLALTGVVVTRIAPNGEVAWSPGELCIDAGNLPEESAKRLLTLGLMRYGPVPIAADPEHPADLELVAIRAHVKKIQVLFELENGRRVALR